MTEQDPRTEEQILEDEERDDTVIAVVFKRSLYVFALIAAVVVVYLVANRNPAKETTSIERDPIEAPSHLAFEEAARPVVKFTDVTRESGLTFVHYNGATGEKLLPETMGSGAAWFDLEGDGDPDLLLLNGRHWPWDPAPKRATTAAMYRNNGLGQFEDVTDEAGLQESLYATGVACGDVDNDGDTDLFIAALGTNRLLLNQGGVFQDVSQQAGVTGSADVWSTSAGFLDYDNDGWLDLFVCNYIAWNKEVDIKLNFSINGVDRAYGPPTNYPGAYCYLYRNKGGGQFEDVSKGAGIQVANPVTGEPLGKALATTFADVDQDGYLDIIVANDTVQNFLFHNQNGRFEEKGSQSGLAFNAMGGATGAMGVDIADFANRGLLGLGVANFANEATSFYVQQTAQQILFSDMANSQGIGSPSRLKLSFGLFFFDYDLDGRLDLLQANGHLENEISEVQPSQTYQQSAQLFWNRGSGRGSTFIEVPAVETGDLATPIVGRGATYADMDGDGDLDVLLTQVAGPALLLRNDSELDHHWLRVKLVGKRQPEAIGARVSLTANGVTQSQRVMPTRSYLTQVELPVTFGLGTLNSVESLTITWPGGNEQAVVDVELDQVITVHEQ